MVLEKSYINPILKQILKTTHLDHYDIITEEYESIGRNYAAEIYFVRVKNSENSETLNLCIKRAFVDEKIRKFLPIRDFYLNEIHFYEHVWTSFKKFQENYTQLPFFDKIPECYLTKSYKNEETLVFKKLSHFIPNDIKVLFNKEQLVLIFKEYAKFHALSFAYKEKNPEEFKFLVEKLKDNTKHYKNIKLFVDTMKYSHELCKKFLVTGKDDELIKKYEKYVENAMSIYLEISEYKGTKSVINHGDCWISNYLFKYNDDPTIPEDVRFVDFQLARLGTPVYDLSCCMYACSTEENYSNLNYFLNIYYQSLSESLVALQCDPEKVYSYQDLKNDWKTYAKFGFTYGVFVIRNTSIDDDMIIKDTNELVEINNARKNEDLRFDEVSLRERFLGLIRHMAENDFL